MALVLIIAHVVNHVVDELPQPEDVHFVGNRLREGEVALLGSIHVGEGVELQFFAHLLLVLLRDSIVGLCLAWLRTWKKLR